MSEARPETVGYMKKWPMVAALCVAFSLSACHRQQPQDLILGKWKTGQGGLKVTAEFDSDGTAQIGMFGKQLRGTYQLAGEDLVWTLNGITTRCKVKVTATDLVVTGNDGNTVVYQRE